MDISSTNATFLLSIPQIGIINHQLQGFASDTAFSTSNVAVTENLIGVDGLKSSGYVPQLASQDITLQADSPSLQVFIDCYEFMRLTKAVVIITGIIQIHSVGLSYALTNGTLENYKPVLDAQRVMQPANYSINWGGWLVAPI